MEVNNYKRKFKILFDKFFQGNFELSRDYCEKLLRFLQDSPDKGAGKILETPFFSDLVLYSGRKIQHATTSVKIFIFELLSIALKNELQFIRLVEMQIFPLLQFKIRDIQSAPLTIAVINCATVHISHSTGLHWTIKHKIWKCVLFPDVHHKTIKIARAAYKYMASLIWKLNEYEEETALTEVLHFLSEPIIHNPYQNLQNLDAESEKTVYDPILPYLNALMEILGDTDNLLKENKVIQLLTTYFILEPHLSLILEVTRDQFLACLLSEVCFKLYFACTKGSSTRNNKTDSDVTYETYIEFYNFIQFLIHKRLQFTTIDFVVRCSAFWNKLGAKVPSTFERYGKTFEIQDQFISVLVVTILKCSAKHCKDSTVAEAIECYAMKLTNIMTEHTIKVAYMFKEVIEPGDMKRFAIQAIRYIFKLKGHLKPEQAGTLYQALYYKLRMYILCDTKGDLILSENPLETHDDVTLLSLAMDAIKMLLKDHDITWYKSCEVICLQNSLMNLLKQNILPSKLLIQALDLITITINKFMSPDLSLLVESKSGSTLNETCAVMKTYLQHDEWEIRDSALYLLLSCTEISFIKYQSLQKLISENNLLVLATYTALSDPEFYVQTAALKCLAAATKLETIWKEILTVHRNLYMQLIYVMKHNSEGIVRKEAAKVLTEIYTNQKVTDNFLRCLYEIMYTAILEDLHWEVQMAALNFWKQVIKTHMLHRGMLDGKFPSVTFSREKRKIIVLNQEEIQRQLTSIMNDLSSIGCLTVLNKCLEEDYRINVMEKAYDISKELINILDSNKFDGIPYNGAVISNVQTIDLDDIVCDETDENAMDLSYTLQTQKDNRDDIIEMIVGTNQADLIMELYDNMNNIKTETDDSIGKLEKITVMHPNIFLENFKNTDYFSIIQSKKNWLLGVNNLDALLDELLDLSQIKPGCEPDCTQLIRSNNVMCNHKFSIY